MLAVLMQSLARGADLCAGARVLAVRKGTALARRRLDEHVMSLQHELPRARRRERDAVLVGLDLLGDADTQDARTLAGRTKVE